MPQTSYDRLDRQPLARPFRVRGLLFWAARPFCMPRDPGKQIDTLLTATEILTLQAVAATDTAKQAAAVLGVERCTVEWHLRRIYEKLGVSVKHRAILAAVKAGVLTL